MNKKMCGSHPVIDKPFISLSHTLGPAILADQDLVITESCSGLKWHLGPCQDSGQELGVRYVTALGPVKRVDKDLTITDLTRGRPSKESSHRSE